MKKSINKSLLLVAVFAIMMFAMTITSSASTIKVTGVKQTIGRTNSFEVKWDGVVASDIGGYVVYYSADKVNWAEDKKYGSTYAYISGLASGKTYYVKVQAFLDIWHDYALVGQPSDIIDVVTAPDVITSNAMKQTAATPNSVTVSYPAVSGATGYQAYYYQSGQEVYVGSTTAAAYTMKTASAGQHNSVYVYPYRISSKGFVAKSDYYYASTYSAPGVVKDVAVDWRPVSQKKISLTWTRNTNDYYSPSGYQVEIKTLAGKKVKTYTVKSSYGSLKFMHKKVKNKGFKVRIRAYYNVNGKACYGNWTKSKTVVPQCSITKNSYTRLSSSSVRVNFKKVAGAKKYYVYVAKNTSSSYNLKKADFKKVATLGANASSYVISGLSSSKYTSIYVIPEVKVGGKKVKGTPGEYMSYWISTYYY